MRQLDILLSNALIALAYIELMQILLSPCLEWQRWLHYSTANFRIQFHSISFHCYG